MADPATKLTALLRKITIDDDEEALKTANAALKISKNNYEALHTRVVALIRLDRFEDALRAIEDGGSKLAERCLLEKTYATYKAGHLTEAALLSQDSKNRGINHVAAQVAYRAGKLQLASRLYEDLSRNDSSIQNEDIDLKVNTLAIDAQICWQRCGDKAKGATKKPSQEDLNLFEISYNYACILIAQDDLENAIAFLQTAQHLCEGSEDMSEEEKKSELLSIILQQAYVFMRIGKYTEAQDLYNSINTADISEAPTKAIAQNNILASTKNENPFLSQRIFDSIHNHTNTVQHSLYQLSILQRNKYVIDIEAKKYSGVFKSTLQIISKTSPTISLHLNLLSVINAAAHARNETGKAGLKYILPLLEKRPYDVGLILTVIQLYIQINNISQATSHLEKFLQHLEEMHEPVYQDVRFAPGLVALLISLYQISGQKTAIRSILSKAACYWRQKSQPCIPILRAAAISLLGSTDPEDLSAATDIFESFRDKNPDDPIAIAGCVASYARHDMKKVSSDLDKLTPVSQLISDIDINALENAGIPSLSTCSLKQSDRKRSYAEEKKANAKKRKLSKKRMPKNFEEGKKMDPERWLPMRDRSYYRPKVKKGKKKIVELTQGGIVTEPDNLEIASSSRIVKNEKNNASKAKKRKGKK